MHANPTPSVRVLRGLLQALPGLLIAGLAAVSPVCADEAPPASPPSAYVPPESVEGLLRVDDEMRAYFAARVDPHAAGPARLQAIVRAIIGPQGLNFAYEAEGTYDARETFHRRRGNCQGFSFLVVAMARLYGLDARFQDMETFQRWNRFGKFVASVRHCNVYVGNSYESYVVDLRPDLGRPTLTDSRFAVRDERAIALFYSTSGFFRLVEGDAARALHLMELATRTDPHCATVWSNLGNLQSQRGDLRAARASFEQALAWDSREAAALTGLVDVLRRLGGPEELRQAAKYEQRAQSCRERNPYYAYHLAEQALESGDAVAAEKSLRRAIRLKSDETLFHEELVRLLGRQGRADDARRAEEKLTRLRARLAQAAMPLMP